LDFVHTVDRSNFSMATLSIAINDHNTKLVYHYLASSVCDINVQESSSENSSLTLSDGTNISGSSSIIKYLTENFGKNSIGAKDPGDVTEAGLSTHQRFGVPNLTRWFDFIQHTATVESGPRCELNIVEIDLNAPKIVKAIEPKRTKSDKPRASDQGPITESPPSKQKATKKSDKKDQKKESGDVVDTNAAGSLSSVSPRMLDLRVGHIIKAEKHPDADSLYVEQIDVGEADPRTVVSGLVKHIPIDQIQDRDVVLLCNLKPAAMRGIKSFAMVLAATSAEGKVELVEPPEGSKPGDRVYFEGSVNNFCFKYSQGSPEPLLNPKKKIWETLQPGLITTTEKVASWVNQETKGVHLLRTQSGLCTVPSVVHATIK
ncbi:13315_t:CDS:2, partial [Acaulospora colombiana]